ncbi:MAG TPA: c-type cytochrome [Burkholderiales bacterium]|nr:c-type cytochrome [Burkholderiales bacterium]
MNLRRISVPGILALLLLAAAPVSAQGDAAAGKDKNAMCQGCHGIEGFRTAYPTVYSVPMLGGQSAAYLAAALKAYRSGDRNNETMHAIAAGLSDQDIEDLAAYYSSMAN